MNENKLMRFINYIEDKSIKVNDNWFYHATRFNERVIKNILINGIKSNILQGTFYVGGDNGLFYICLSKNVGIKDGAFDLYTKKDLTFVLSENIKAIKTSGINSKTVLFRNTPFPIREGFYEDEYQVFGFINNKNIIALEYYLKYLVEQEKMIEYKIQYLEKIKELVIILDSLNIDLPIYDYSTMKEINKRKVLLLGEV